MLFFKKIIIFFIKKIFLNNSNKDLEKFVFKNILRDSRALGLIFITICLLTIFFLLGAYTVLISSFSLSGANVAESIFYSGLILIITSIVGISSCYIFIKKKIACYKKVNAFKGKVNGFSFLSPLFNQISIEHRQMTRHLASRKNKQ